MRFCSCMLVWYGKAETDGFRTARTPKVKRELMIRLFGYYMPRSILLLALIETAVLAGAAYAALPLRLSLAGLSPTVFSDPVPTLAIFVLTVQIVMLVLGLYQRETCRDFRNTIVTIFAAFPLAALILALIFFFFPSIAVWRSIFVIAFFLSLAGVLVSRALFLAVVDMERFRRRVMVLGAGRLAKRILDLQSNTRAQGFTCVAFIRMGEEETQVPEFVEREDVQSLQAFAREHDVDEIVTAMEERRVNMPLRDLLECRLAGIRISDYSGFIEREAGKVDLDGFVPSWLIYSEGSTAGPARLFVKRTVDLISSGILMVVTVPFMLITAIAIAVTSPGPVLYRQERVGQGGEPFTLFKFRSMLEDAESQDGPKWAEERDPRITPVGNIIRKLRIDELPQIINVLKGDMSFVGPRPERPFFVEQIAQEVPYYLERHTVRPGITGWAQVNYPYGASIEDAKQKVEYDLYYIKNFSFFLDILTLIRTIRVVLFPSGAR